MNFVNALEKIPGIIAQYEERTAKLKADVPQLEAIISKSWGKEDELKQLKSDLAALDRKITTALAPTHEVPDDRMGVNKEEQDGEEVKRDDPSQQVEAPAQSTGSKESMVAGLNIVTNPRLRVFDRHIDRQDYNPRQAISTSQPGLPVCFVWL